jgi:hypothetical protein
MKNFSVPQLPFYEIGVPHYRSHSKVIMMGEKDVLPLGCGGKSCKNSRKKEKSSLKFKRKHFSEMSDGIFYYPKYLLHEKFIYILHERNSSRKE